MSGNEIALEVPTSSLAGGKCDSMYSLSSGDILGWLAGESKAVKIHRMNHIIPMVPVGGSKGLFNSGL